MKIRERISQEFYGKKWANAYYQLPGSLGAVGRFSPTRILNQERTITQLEMKIWLREEVSKLTKSLDVY